MVPKMIRPTRSQKSIIPYGPKSELSLTTPKIPCVKTFSLTALMTISILFFSGCGDIITPIEGDPTDALFEIDEFEGGFDDESWDETGVDITDDFDETEVTVKGVSNPITQREVNSKPKPKTKKYYNTKDCYPIDGQYQSKLDVKKGEKEVTIRGKNEDVNWARGGGCILLPIRELWGKLHNKEVFYWPETDSGDYTFAPIANTNPKASHRYETSYGASAGTTWKMHWIHSIKAGTIEKPKQILLSYGKVLGTTHIPIWRGNVLLTYVAEDITSFKAIDQIQGDFWAKLGPEDAEGTVIHFFNHLLSPETTSVEIP